MTRKLHYLIEEVDAGKQIGMFLQERAYSRGVLIELKKDPIGIRRNGMWARVNEVLYVGDLLEICLIEETSSEQIVPMKIDFDVLYEDADLLVMNKPYDTPIHPSINNYGNTLANGVMHYYKEKGEAHTFRCMNRLDRDTTGVTIIAKHLLSASILSKSVQEHQISRLYVALVEGVTKERGTVDLPIGRMEDSIIKRQIDLSKGKAAVTHYERLEVFEIEGQAVSLVALQLETGRTHQIRVHMSGIGHPLLGDFLYNETNHMLSRQALHGAQCRFGHPITGEFMQVTAPLAEDMKDVIYEGTGIVYDQAYLAYRLDGLAWEKG